MALLRRATAYYKGLRPYKRALIALASGAVLLAVVTPRAPLNKGISVSRELYARDGRLLRLTLSSDDKFRRWVPLADISPALKEAVLMQEDRFFFYHPGVNPASLVKGFWQSYVAKRGFRMGGSTISMQLARLLYRINSRSVGGKVYQVFKALELELLYSKKSILEAYLNLVPCGGNIEGFASASLIYFSKDTSRLTVPEIMTLCVIPKSPVRRALGPGKAGTLQEADKARRRLFARWLGRHAADARYAEAFPAFGEIKSAAALPFRAPHFVDAILRGNPVRNRLETTLDLGAQELMERQLRNYVSQKRNLGILNASALLIDISSVEVRGMVGSADFYNDKIEGQINGTTIKRSPGSTLKPFIYGLALDQGLIHPATILKDTPVSYGGFNPENFDRDFSGPVRAQDALIRSRNIPAVNLFMQLAPPGFYGFMKKAGVAPLREENYYGLTLALGGVEISMQKLGELYAMLANGGEFRPARYLSAEASPATERLLSAEAAFIVNDMLKANPRPDQGFRTEWTMDRLPVAWKTGTSFGFRDAWAAGIFGHYALLVWVGNFDREMNPAFVGVEAAAPLMFRMMDALRLRERNMAQAALPAGKASRVEICAVSGQIPGPHCRKRAQTWFIPGASPIKICDIHRAVLVDSRTGLRACRGDKKWVKSEVYEFWPSDILKVFRLGGIPRKLPPQDDPACPGGYSGETAGTPPIITSPQAGVTYNLRMRKKHNLQLPLSAVTDADTSMLYWFMNQKFVGKSKSGETFFAEPPPGQYVVRVVDDKGRSDLRDVSIQVAD